MFRLANFDAPKDEMVFFGLRGVSPIDPAGGFASSHPVQEKGVDFQHMRCSIGQWLPGSGIALHAGSTVPHLSGVQKGVASGGSGVNMLATCFLTDLPGTTDHRYSKGDHGISSELGPHRAFRNSANLPIWRTGDDADYEGDDRLVYEQAFDNLHCARRLDMNTPKFSSLGCQVVAGLAGGPTASPGGEVGPWKVFVEAAYGRGQTRFSYALFNEGEATRTAVLGPEKRVQTVRFGSTGELARHVQKGLLARGFDVGEAGADGVIGFQTLRAIRDVQLAAFGSSEVDLVVGPATAKAIGIDWPAAGDGLPDPGAARPPHPGAARPPDPAPAESRSIAPPREEAPAPPAGPVFAAEARREMTPGGKFRWVFDDPVDGRRRYLGLETAFKGFVGLARTRGFDSEAAPLYDHADWLDAHGPWAALIEPTGEGESTNSFTCINSYDRAAFTFGFFQLAAHTPNDNLALLLRRLLETDEADRYFPDLALADGKVHLRGDGGLRPLEGAAPRSDGDARAGDQGALMEYLNGSMRNVDEPELRAAARLVHWACHSGTHRSIQVALSVDLARRKVKRIATSVTSHGAELDGRPLPVVAMALDILHNGRGGRSTFQQIADALNAADPMAELRKIGRGAFADRIDRVAQRATTLLGTGPFGRLRYDAQTNELK